MAAPAPAPAHRLITIPISHFCEKARWALERAGIPYRETRHVQGIHMLAAKRAGGGLTVPVLVTTSGEVLAESEQIIAFADRELPEERRLIPSDPQLRREVLETSRWLDRGLGPEGRRLMYVRMLHQRTLMLEVNNQGVPAWEARFLAATWPLSTRAVKLRLGIGSDAAEVSQRRVEEAFDEIARRLEVGGGYLCGSRFTAADLTFAALSAAVLVPPQYGVTLPQPATLPAEMAQLIEGFRAHPAGQRALALFAEHRRTV